MREPRPGGHGSARLQAVERVQARLMGHEESRKASGVLGVLDAVPCRLGRGTVEPGEQMRGTWTPRGAARGMGATT